MLGFLLRGCGVRVPDVTRIFFIFKKIFFNTEEDVGIDFQA